MDWAVFVEWIDVVTQMLPFTDLGSDIYLLVLVWPGTKISAPSDLGSCEQEALW